MKNDTLKGQHRINEQIRAKEVRIVGDDIESAVYPIAQALKLAEEHDAGFSWNFTQRCSSSL